MKIVITQTIELDHCWVCPSCEGLHQHHVVPTSYGGEHGPQVTLCGTHHTLIHAMSLTGKERWKFEGTVTQQLKLQYLTGVIALSRSKTKHLARPMQLSNKLDIQRSAKFRAIQKLMGFSSLQKTLEWCVDNAYDKVAPLPPRK